MPEFLITGVLITIMFTILGFVHDGVRYNISFSFLIMFMFILFDYIGKIYYREIDSKD